MTSVDGHEARWAPLGRALLDFHHGATSARIVVQTDLWHDEVMPVEEFYRPDEQPLPKLERIALVSQGTQWQRRLAESGGALGVQVGTFDALYRQVLRAAGEVVINCLSGEPDPRCDRQLLEEDGRWQLHPIED